MASRNRKGQSTTKNTERASRGKESLSASTEQLNTIAATATETDINTIKPAEPDELRFIVDVMLGKLAKWLRILGYDTLYRRDWQDDELLACAAAEGRILLTADRELVRRRQGERKIYVSAVHWPEQLRELAQVLPLSMERAFTRCIECNVLLEHVSKEEVRTLVPPYVYQTQEEFGRCPVCGRIYWKGTHFAHALSAIAEIIQNRRTEEISEK